MEKQHIIIERLGAMHTKLLKTMNDLKAKGIEIKDVLPIAAVEDELEHLIKPAIQYQLEQPQTTTVIGCKSELLKFREEELKNAKAKTVERVIYKIQREFYERLVYENSSTSRTR